MRFEDKRLNAFKNVEELFTVKPGYSIDTGLYHCEVQSTDSVTTTDETLIDAKIILWVVVPASIGQNEVISTEESFALLQGFTVHTSEIQLTNYQVKGIILVSGIYDTAEVGVNADPSDKNILSITDTSDNENTYQFTVELLPGYWNLIEGSSSRQYVTVWSEATKQSVKVPVQIRVVAQPGVADHFGRFDATWSALAIAILSNYQFFLWIVFTILLAVVSAYVAQRMFWVPGYYASQQQGVFVNSPQSQIKSAPVTPRIMSSEMSRRLWSTGSSQTYGTPTLQRSPPHRQSPYQT